MARPLRSDFPGALWHIISRGVERRDICRDDRDRRRFVNLLATVVAERGWLLHSWVLMSNHYHLLLETPERGLSRGLKWLNQAYAETFNRRYDRVGHLFQGRFRSIPVQREGQLLELLRYIVLNPVRCHAVAFPGDYEWSNYRATAGLERAPSWLEVGWTLDQFAGDRAKAHDGYRHFVADARGATWNPWESVRSSSTFASLVSLVCERYSLTPDDLRRRSRSDARKALCHLVSDSGATLLDAAQWLGVSAGAASRLRASSAGRYARDSCFRASIDAMRAALKSTLGSDPLL